MRIIIGLIALLCLVAGGLMWILSLGRVLSGDWSTILPVVFVVLAAAFALFTWLFPFSPVDTQEPPATPLSISSPQVSQPTPNISTPTQQQTEASQPMWNIPFRRNPFFTGRENLLNRLHINLTTTKAAALTQAQAISGLGGIGKTHTAVEYAYRYRDEYHCVLWVNAATRDTIITSFLDLAALLALPEQQEQDQQKIVAAVLRWFATHDQWLGIFDNADDLSLVEAFLPPGGKGHLLLTTRAQAPGTLANGIPVEEMDLQEGMLLLLRRAKVLAPDASLDQASATDRAVAEVITRAMDGLPLALDQAGAYIEETHCSLSSYQKHYWQQQSRLLHRRGGIGKDHPEPVATTWSLSFAQVEHLNPAAADLLRCCAFLAPDAIPEQLIVGGASELGPHLQAIATDVSLFDEAMSILLRYSLVQRKRDEQTITVHRLVQAVLRNTMDATTQRTWAERTVRAINRTFPDVTDYRTWSRCQQYLPHALACVSLMDQWDKMFPQTGALLNKVGYYLEDRAQYAQAEPLFQRAIAIGEQMLGPENPDLASYINNLANLYRKQGKYEQAEPLFQRAITIGEKMLGPEHPKLATRLNNLAELYRKQGKYEQAEPLYQRALAIYKKTFGPHHPSTKTIQGNYTLFLEEKQQKKK